MEQKIAPECSFANGQLARHMQNPNEEHWKEMERLVGYLKGKEKHELIIRKPQNMRVISYGDSSYADCKDTRQSTSGDLHTLGGALVSWRSQRLKMICLSSTEAEYVTMTEMAKEQRFLQMLIEELTGSTDKGIIYGDNEASVYLSKNKHVSARTKHIDIKSHYIRKHIEENRAIIKPTRSEDNFSDIFTKNTTVSTFKKLSEAILKGFQGWEDKFTWTDAVNVIHYQNKDVTHDQKQRENVEKNNQQKKHENIFERNDLEEMEKCYKKYKKRIGKDLHVERANIAGNSKVRRALCGSNGTRQCEKPTCNQYGSSSTRQCEIPTYNQYGSKKSHAHTHRHTNNNVQPTNGANTTANRKLNFNVGELVHDATDVLRTETTPTANLRTTNKQRELNKRRKKNIKQQVNSTNKRDTHSMPSGRLYCMPVQETVGKGYCKGVLKHVGQCEYCMDNVASNHRKTVLLINNTVCSAHVCHDYENKQNFLKRMSIKIDQKQSINQSKNNDDTGTITINREMVNINDLMNTPSSHQHSVAGRDQVERYTSGIEISTRGKLTSTSMKLEKDKKLGSLEFIISF